MLMNTPRLFERMKREGMDAIVATAPENVTYTSGFWAMSQWIRHGKELAPAAMEALIARAGRVPAQRNTLYGAAPAERRARSFAAAPLSGIVLTPLRRRRAVAVPT